MRLPGLQFAPGGPVAYSSPVERRTGIIGIKLTQADELVSSAVPGARALSCRLLPEGKSNTNYWLQLMDGRFVVLRVYARDDSACAKERDLHSLLSGVVPMPAMLGTCPPGTAGIPHGCAVLEYVRGAALSDLQPGNAAGYAVGRVLAKIGSFEFEKPGDLMGDPLRVEPWSFGEDASVGFVNWCVYETRAGDRLGLAMSKRLLNYTRDCSERWPELRTQSKLVHGDFNPTNLLIDVDRVSAILDWEWAHAGSPLADLANLLREREEFKPARAFVDGVLQGRAEGGLPVPEDWQERTAYLDLLSAVEFLTSTADRPQLHARAMQQIRKTLGA